MQAFLAAEFDAGCRESIRIDSAGTEPGGGHDKPAGPDGVLGLDSPIKTVLESLKRKQLPSSRALEIVGDDNPDAAARSLLRAVRTPELATSCDSWVPALLLSPRPGLGASRLCDLAYAYAKASGEALDLSRMPALASVLGTSDALGLMLVNNPEWANDLMGDPPAPPLLTLHPECFDEVREIRARGLLSAAARDLLGCPVQSTLVELSALADFYLVESFRCAGRKLKISVPALFALGQLGSCDSGFRSALEVLCVDEVENQAQGSRDGTGGTERQLELTRLLECVRSEFSKSSDSGSLDILRPMRPLLGLVADSVESAVGILSADHCEELGRLSEHVRPLFGSDSLSTELTSRVWQSVASQAGAGFGWSRERARRAARIETADAEDLVLASGGIRDIETIVRHLEPAIDEVVEQGVHPGILTSLYRIDETHRNHSGVDSQKLIDAYCWLRRAEHALHFMTMRGSHFFPQDPVGQQRLARCMGYREVDVQDARSRLLADRQLIRQAVENQFDSIFEPSGN